MDAFFASVEVRDNPGLAGRPVAVGGAYGNKGVVTSANYIARQYGLHAGMSALEARRLCPQTVFLPVNARKYTYVSARIMAALERFSPDVHPLSIDEASLEITGCLRLFGGAKPLAGELKEVICSRFRLPCTVGVGPNRLVAKMAANIAKPDGLMLIGPDEAAAVFARLPVSEMVGIGKSTARALNSLGIRTLGRLAETPEELLRQEFGMMGPLLKRMARGEWGGRMRQEEERGPAEKSMGHERTFGEPLGDPIDLRGKLVALAEMVARRVRRAGCEGRVLTLKLRYSDFQTIHHQSVLPDPTDDEELLIEHAWRLLEETLAPGKTVRLLGLSLGRLKKKMRDEGQLDIFNAGVLERRAVLYRAVDGLRDRFGERVVARGMGQRWRSIASKRSTFGVIPLHYHSAVIEGQSSWVSALEPLQ